jgi:alpha-L-fucosidase
MDKAFERNLNATARVSASSSFGAGFIPSNILNGGAWAAKESNRKGAWLQLDLAQPVTFDLIRLREDTRYGVRIDDFVVETTQGGGWREIARHTCIGAQRVIRLETPVTAQKVRLRVTKAAASPVIAEFSLYRLPEIVEDPVIVRDDQGVVTVTAPGEGLDLYCSVDGSAPSVPYVGPIPMAGGGKVRAIARRRSSGLASAVITADYDIVKSGWRVVSCNGDNGAALLAWDESPDGGQCDAPKGQPLDVVLDLGRSYDATGFTIQRGQWMPYGGAAPDSCRVWLSTDGGAWGEPVLQADLTGLRRNRSLARIPFASPVSGRYLRVHLPHAVDGAPIISIARVGITTTQA